VVTIGKADVLQIVVLATGAYALLGSGGAGVVTLVESEKDILELVHTRVGEQQGWVVRGHERGGVNLPMTLLNEEVQEHATDLVAT
jgi:hypothetical protein